MSAHGETAAGTDPWAGVSMNGEKHFRRLPVTCICGSSRFYRDMLRVATELTARGQVVLMPFDDVESEPDAERVAVLSGVHRERIRLADRVVVMTGGASHGVPGQIARTVPIDLPEPRDVTTPAFNAYKREISDLVHGAGDHA